MGFRVEGSGFQILAAQTNRKSGIEYPLKSCHFFVPSEGEL